LRRQEAGGRRQEAGGKSKERCKKTEVAKSKVS